MIESRGIRVHFWSVLVYLLFVIYGSLVPFDYNPITFDQAFNLFKKIPYLDLGIESRADWVANGVLYVPVGFLIFQYLLQLCFRPFFAFFIGFILSAVLAFGIEYAQLFFPPRTVSINDLIAESIGSLLGLLISYFATNWFRSLIKSSISNFSFFHRYILDVYAFFYFSYSLFPYDFLLRFSEIEQKVNSDKWGWFFAVSYANDSFFINFSRLSLEVLMAVPIGILLGRLTNNRYSSSKVIIASVFLGALIEFSQFFIASGVSQGWSVVCRVVGFFVGLKLYAHRFKWGFNFCRNLIISSIVPISILYSILLLSITGWFSHSWGTIDQALYLFFNKTNFIPFYYHYYTTEAIALQSLVEIIFLYIPIGIIAWAFRKSSVFAGFLALMICSFMEISKLFILSKHPDPTNLIIVFTSNYILVNYLLFSENNRANFSKNIDFESSIKTNMSMLKKTSASKSAYVFIVLGFLCFFYWVFSFPVFKVSIFFAAISYFILIWFKPVLIFFLIPMLLIIDLAPWSGRFFIDEFDILVLFSSLIGFVKFPGGSKSNQLSAFVILGLWLVAISYLISTVLGLLPFQSFDSNALSNYFSSYNALRISKGVLWFFPIFFLAIRQKENGVDVERMFRRGMIFALSGTIIFVLIERFAFTGFFDFSNEHRVVGPFSAIHIGGAYIECFLVACIPFLLVEILETRWISVQLFGVLLLVLATYAIMITYSRGGYFAFAISLLFYLIFQLLKKGGGRILKRNFMIAVIMLMVLVVAIPIVSGKFAQARLLTIELDYQTRLKHWKEAIDMVDGAWTTKVFGMGIGKFPITYYLTHSEEALSGWYRILNDEGQSYIRLGVGQGLYIDQAILSSLKFPLTVSFKVRASSPNSQVAFTVCQKWLLSSVNCSWQASLITRSNKWLDQQVTINQGQVDIATKLSFVPYFFSFANPSQAVIDISEIRLLSNQGQNILSNSSFQDGLDRWFFQSDQHLPWHAKNLFLAIYFDQGLFGLMVFVALFSLSVIGAIRTRQEHWALALIAFIIVGLFDSLVDSPRFVFLLMVLINFPYILKSQPILKRKII